MQAIEESDLGESQRAKLLEQARRLYSADGRRRNISLRRYAGAGWHRAGRWTLEVDTSNAYDGHHQLLLERCSDDACGVASFRAEHACSAMTVPQMHSRLEFVVKRDGREVFRDDRTDLWTSIRDYPFREMKLDHPAVGETGLGVSSVAFDLRKPCGSDYWTIDNLSVQVAYADYERVGASDGDEYVDALNWQRQIAVYELRGGDLALLTFDADNDAEHLAFFADNLPVFQSLMEPPHLCQRRWHLYAAVSHLMVRFGEEARTIEDEALRHALWRRSYSHEAAVAIAADGKLLATIKEMRAASFLPEECCEPFYASLLQYHSEQTSGVCPHELRRIEAHARIVSRCLAPRLAKLRPWCVVWDRRKHAPWIASAELELCVMNTAQALVWLEKKGNGLPPIRPELCAYYSASVAEHQVLGKCIYADSERMVLDVFKSGDRHCIPSAPIELPLGHASEIQSAMVNPGKELAAELVRYLEHHDHPEQHIDGEEPRTQFLAAASFAAKAAAAPDRTLEPEGDRTPMQAKRGTLAYHVDDRKWFLFRQDEGASTDDVMLLEKLETTSAKRIDPDNNRLWVPPRIPNAAWLSIKQTVLEAASQRRTDTGAVVRDFVPPARFVTSDGSDPASFSPDGAADAWLAANALKDARLPVLRWLSYVDYRWRRHDCLVSVTGPLEFRIYWHNGAWVYGSPAPLAVQAASRSRYRFSRLPGPIRGLYFVPTEADDIPLFFVVAGTLDGDTDPYRAKAGDRAKNKFSTADKTGETQFEYLNYGRDRSTFDVPDLSLDESFTYRLSGLPPVEGVDEQALASLASLGTPNGSELWDLLVGSLAGKKGAYYQAKAALALLVDQAYTNGDDKRFGRISPASTVALKSGAVAVKIVDNLGRELTEKPKRFLDSPDEISAAGLVYDNDAGAGKAYALAGLGPVKLAANLERPNGELDGLLSVEIASGVWLYVPKDDVLRTQSDMPVAILPQEMSRPPARSAALPDAPAFVQFKLGGDVTFYGLETNGSNLVLLFCYAREGQLPEAIHGAVDKAATEPAKISAEALTDVYNRGPVPSRWMAWLALASEAPASAPAPAPAPAPVPLPNIGEIYYAAGGYRIRTSANRSVRITEDNGDARDGTFKAEDGVPPQASTKNPAQKKKKLYASLFDLADGKTTVYVYDFASRSEVPIEAYKHVGPDNYRGKMGHSYAALEIDATSPRLSDMLDTGDSLAFKSPVDGLGDSFFFLLQPGALDLPLNGNRLLYEPFACLRRDGRTVAIYRHKTGGDGRTIVGTVRLNAAQALLAASKATGDAKADDLLPNGPMVVETQGPPSVYLVDSLVLSPDDLGANRARQLLGAAARPGSKLPDSAIEWKTSFTQAIFDAAPSASALDIIYGSIGSSKRDFFASNKAKQLLRVEGSSPPRFVMVEIPPNVALVSALVGLSELKTSTEFDIRGGQRTTVDPVNDTLDDVIKRATKKAAPAPPPPTPAPTPPTPAPPPKPTPKTTPAPPPPTPAPASRYEWVGVGDRILWDKTAGLALLREPAPGASPQLVVGGGRQTRPIGAATPVSEQELRLWLSIPRQLDTGDLRSLAVRDDDRMHLIVSGSAELVAGEVQLRLNLEPNTAYVRTFAHVPGTSPSFAYLEQQQAAAANDWGARYAASADVVVERLRRADFARSKTRFVWNDQGSGVYYYGRALWSDGTTVRPSSADAWRRMKSVPAELIRNGMANATPAESALIVEGRLRHATMMQDMPKDDLYLSRRDVEAGYGVKVGITAGEFTFRYKRMSFDAYADPPEVDADFSPDDRFDLLSQLSQASQNLLYGILSVGLNGIVTLVDLDGKNLAIWNASSPASNRPKTIPTVPNGPIVPIGPPDLIRYRLLKSPTALIERRCIERQLTIYSDDDKFKLNDDGTFRCRDGDQIDLETLWRRVKAAGPEPDVPGRDALYDALSRVVVRHRTLAVVRLAAGGGLLAVGGLDESNRLVQVFYRKQSPWKEAGAGGAWIPLALADVAVRPSDGRPDVADISNQQSDEIVAEAILQRATPFVSSSGRRYLIASTPGRGGAARQDATEVLYVVDQRDARASHFARSCSDTVDAVRVVIDTATRTGDIRPVATATLLEMTFYKPEEDSAGGFKPVNPAVTALLDAIEAGAQSAPKVPKIADLQQIDAGAPAPPPPPPARPPPPPGPPAEPYNALATGYVRGTLELPRWAHSPAQLNAIVVSLPIEGRTLFFEQCERYSSPGGLLLVARRPLADSVISRPFGALVVVVSLPVLGQRRFKLAYNLSPEVFFDAAYRHVQLKFRSNDTVASDAYASRILFERSDAQPLWRLAAVVVSLSALYDRRQQ